VLEEKENAAKPLLKFFGDCMMSISLMFNMETCYAQSVITQSSRRLETKY